MTYATTVRPVERAEETSVGLEQGDCVAFLTSRPQERAAAQLARRNDVLPDRRGRYGFLKSGAWEPSPGSRPRLAPLRSPRVP